MNVLLTFLEDNLHVQLTCFNGRNSIMVIQSLKSCGVKSTRSHDGFASEFVLDVFESTKDLVTMERAALFKKKKNSKIMVDVFMGNVSNHKRICRHLVQIFFKTIVKGPDKRLKSVSTRTIFSKVQNFGSL